MNYTNSIEDSVLNVKPGRYYLIDASKHKELIPFASRVLKNQFIIIKGERINLVNVNENFYLLNNLWKFSSKISPKIRGDKNLHVFSIKYTDSIDVQSLKTLDNIEVIRNLSYAHVLIVKTTFRTLENALPQFNSIEYIDLAERSPVEESPLRQYNPSINRITTAKHNYPNLTGNIVVSLKENSINPEDIDLLGKVTLDANSSAEFTQHAKEMATVIGGLGNSFITGEGVATGSSFVCTDFSSLFPESPEYYSNYNIHVQNHSYGTGIENYYGNESVSYDQIASDIPELALVFSAGNAGSTAPESGTYQGLNGFANLTGDFKQSKNVLVIAAIDSTMNHVSLTSSGPAYDGRLKPELATFGGEGTSESAALASGATAMLQEHFLDKEGSYPSSAMLKSLLIAGANEADVPGIDFKTGYGSINLNKSLQLIDSAWFVTGTVGSNEMYEFKLHIPVNSAQFKIALSWIDPPANPEDAVALVNDLDMLVVSPSNAEFLPWVLDPTPSISNLEAPATRGGDHLNNAEMISIDSPEGGDYLIRIQAHPLSTISQSFSISYCIQPNEHFEWSYPTSSDILQATTSTYLRWENTFPSQNGTAYIKYGVGDWVSLGATDVRDEQLKFDVPDTTTYAQLKMEIGANTFVSDIFVISQLIQIKTENDCDSNFTLSWDKSENMESYTLYGLQNNILTPLLTTSDTLLTLEKQTYPQAYFAVQPSLTSGFPGLRSFAIDYTDQNAGCYLRNFLALLQPENFVSIELELNSPYEINKVTIFKEFLGETKILEQFGPGTDERFEFLDSDLEPGKYIYTVQLSLNNGDVISSEPIVVFYTNENTVMVFPNPVTDNSVNVLNDFPGGTLELLDSQGNVINTFELVNIVENINLTGLQKGMYLYRIFYEERVVASGRIMRL